MLLLLSDGIEAQAALNHLEWSLDITTGELAQRLLEKGCAETDDDATVAVIRLRPASLVT